MMVQRNMINHKRWSIVIVWVAPFVSEPSSRNHSAGSEPSNRNNSTADGHASSHNRGRIQYAPASLVIKIATITTPSKTGLHINLIQLRRTPLSVMAACVRGRVYHYPAPMRVTPAQRMVNMNN
eukprot:gene10046-biopygen9243